MKKIKVENSDMFCGLRGVFVQGVLLTPDNISNYDLYKMPRRSTEKQDVYKINKKDRGFYIVHDKENNSVDWCECLD